MAERWRKIPIALAWLIACGMVFSQELPQDEIQFNMNGYFDNFHVNILYPTVSVSKKVSESTGINARYLVDAITAASMRSRFDVDGVTSATQPVDAVTSATTRFSEREDKTFDEVRHELAGGIVQLLGNGTGSFNMLYSTEHDYTSVTLAGNFSHPFAKKNTTLQIGAVRSWDKVFPDHRTWKKDKDVLTISGALTQVFGRNTIAQVDASYIDNRGYLSDPYQVVRIIQGDTFSTLETRVPDTRVRKAAGLRINQKIGRSASLQAGYRYYWDTWEIRSHTFHAMFQHYAMDKNITMGLGWRHYIQNRASFFQPSYPTVQEFMTVDSKLNSGYSDEFEFRAEIKTGLFENSPILGFLADENSAFFSQIQFYNRHTSTPDWYSRYKNLYAYVIGFGWRYWF